MNKFINILTGILLIVFMTLLSVQGYCEELDTTETAVETTGAIEKSVETEAIDAPAAVTDAAVETPEKNTIEALVGLLLEKGVVNSEEADRFVKMYKSEIRSKERKGNVVTIIPDQNEDEYYKQITEDANSEIKKDVAKTKDNLDFVTTELRSRTSQLDDRVTEVERKLSEDVSKQLLNSAWTERVRWGGDIRIRYQKDLYDDENYDSLYDPDKNEIVNTTVDRSRYRYRIRLEAEADIMKKGAEINMGEIKMGARLASGNTDDPVSTNETMGDYFNKDKITLDKVYLKWSYKPDSLIWGRAPSVTVNIGKFSNPWFSTELVWDNDINFEGLAMTIESDTLLEHLLKGFLTAGAFPLQELELYQKDKWLFAGQIGLKYEQPLGLSGKLAAAYYDFKGTSGAFFDDASGTYTNNSEPVFRQVGNALFDINTNSSYETWALAADYKLLNITAEFDYTRWFPFHIIFNADYVRNIGFDREEVSKRMNYSEYPEEIKGYQLGLTVGYPTPRDFGEWNSSLSYKHLGADAVMDAFTDSDFWLGGTNAKGWILGGQFGLSERFWLTGRWMSTDEILGVPISIDRFMFDLNARF